MDDLFAFCPLDGRYRGEVEEICSLFSEYSLIEKRVYIEIEYLIAFLKATKKEKFAEDDLIAIYKNFSINDAKKIKGIERKTKHDIQAVIEFIKSRVPESIVPFVHFGITSEDINNLSYGLIIERARGIYLRKAKEVILRLVEFARKYKNLTMLSRTHGEPATPTTLGKEFANYAVRLSREFKKLKSIRINGKLNGATGNFNALSSIYPEIDWLQFSCKFVRKLGLLSDLFSTQILFPDVYCELFDSLKRINSIIVDLDRNIWNYFLLGYFGLEIEEEAVGSSTMPHKINPIDFENSEGNAELAGNMLSFLSEKLAKSRLQRDLTDSTVKRNIGLAFGYSFLSLRKLFGGLEKLEVNEDIIKRDIEAHDEIYSELIQLYLRKEGIKEGHSIMRNKRLQKHFSYREYLKRLTPSDARMALNFIRGESSKLVMEAIKEVRRNIK